MKGNKDESKGVRKETNEKKLIYIIVILISVIAILGIYIYNQNEKYMCTMKNSYNMAFNELIDYVQNVETYLAKSLISNSPEQGIKNFTNVWREANLAQMCLAQIPIETHELENTAKFLNQVSDYSYALSRKNIGGETLSEEDIQNLEKLHQYSLDLENTINQLSEDINQGKISWSEITKKESNLFTKQGNNISKDSFNSVEENFHEYSGLIYDGAFSEHMTSTEKKGLTGENITEEQAIKMARKFIGEDKIEAIKSEGKSENGNIVSYTFNAKVKGENRNIAIAVSEKGGHVVYMDADREVNEEKISQEEADKKGKEFLEKNGFENMKETYYLKQSGIVTINYAYLQDGVIIYPDLIKLKVALDNGEVLGIETTGYLNCHTERKLSKIKVSKEKALENLNKKLEINSENLAIIPTQWKTELLCWEFKGKIKEMDFLVYVNVETGKEEDILLIINTPNGTLTH